MTDSEISKLILQEFDLKTLGVTEQYLEIHEPIFNNGFPKIDRIDREKDDVIIVYLPVKDEYFSFAVYIDKTTEKVLSVGTESRNLVSLIVTSETLTSNELLRLTKLNCKESWNNGDKKPNSKATYSYSGIEFYLTQEPDEFEDKLNKLLTHLETDKSGITLLASKSKAYIKVIIDFHNGNQLLGELTLDNATIERLNNLNLGIDFQITAWGNSFK